MVATVTALLLIMLHVSPHLVGPVGVVVVVVVAWCLGECFAASVSCVDALLSVLVLLVLLGRMWSCRRRMPWSSCLCSSSVVMALSDSEEYSEGDLGVLFVCGLRALCP
jgi:hypothetical protein